MNCSHLLRAPCDKWVCDFPYEFSGIVDGFMLRRMRSNCVRASCVFLFLFFFFFFCMGTWRKGGQNRTETVRRLYVNLAIPVQSPCRLRRFRTEIVRRSCAGSVQRPCGDGAVTVREPYDQSTFFFPQMTI